MAETITAAAPVLTPAQLLAHWQGHRRLTRRVIEAFPEDQLYAFSIGGMRPFGKMAQEILSMAAPTARGVATEDWGTYDPSEVELPKAEILRRWDEQTRVLDEVWPTIPAERFQATMTAFGQYTGPVHELFHYVIDNEIHHRAQGYVYLRALGIEPPPFYVRD